MPHCPGPARRQRVAGRVSSESGDFAWDPDAARCRGGLARVGPPVDAVRRVPHPARAEQPARSPRVVAGGGAVSVGQPRFSPDGTRLAYVSDATGWWNVWVADADGSQAHAGARGASRPRGADVVPGATFVRVVARRIRDRALPQRGRVRPPHRRRRDREEAAIDQGGAGDRQGLAPLARLGSRRDRRGAFGRAHAADGHGRRPRHEGATPASPAARRPASSARRSSPKS